jgi:hypothetical protein
MTFDVTLTPGLTLTAIDDAGSDAPGSCIAVDAQHIECEVSSFLPSHNIHLSLTVTADGTGPQSVTAEAGSDTSDPDTANNSEVVATAVT